MGPKRVRVVNDVPVPCLVFVLGSPEPGFVALVKAPSTAVSPSRSRFSEMLGGRTRKLSTIWTTPPSNFRSCVATSGDVPSGEDSSGQTYRDDNR